MPRNLTDYAMELVLLGVDIDSLEIISEETREGASVITVEFEVDGDKFAHTHFKYTLKDDFSVHDPVDLFVLERLISIMEKKNLWLFSQRQALKQHGNLIYL